MSNSTIKYTLEITGLILAVLDFTGLSKKLEDKINVLHKSFAEKLRNVNIIKNTIGIMEDVSDDRGCGCLFYPFAFFCLCTSYILSFNAYQWYANFIPNGLGFWPSVIRWTVAILLFIASMYFVVISISLSIFLLNFVILSLLWLLWLLMYIINKAPSKTIGSLGLAVAILSFFIK